MCKLQKKMLLIPILTLVIWFLGVQLTTGYTDDVTYTYDNLNRLIQVTYSSGASITYTYDAAGNRTMVQVTGGNAVPLLTTLSPNSVSAGSGAFTLTVTGSNFVNNAVVKWNGSNRTTTFVSATQLQVAIPASDVVAAGTASVTVINPAPGGGTSSALNFTITPSCTYAITPVSQSFTASGGTGSLSVSTATGCNWSGTSNATFITITSGSSGSGNGSLNYSVAANTGNARNGTITVGGQTFTVTQSQSCTFSINPTNQNFNANGGTGSVNVTSPNGCNWTASTIAGFVTITSGSSGGGNGSVSYSVAPNTGSGSRVATITIASQSLTITQDGNTAGSPSGPSLLDDFESGNTNKWTVFTGGGSTITKSITTGAIGAYGMRIQYNVGVGAWGGVQQVFPSAQNWSTYQLFEFRLYGNNTGNVIRLELADNPVPGSLDDTAERFEYKFTDNFTGWKAYSLPWGSFTRRQDWQPTGAPNDGLTLTQVQAFSFASVSGSGSFRLDQVQLNVNTIIILDDFESGNTNKWTKFTGGGAILVKGIISGAVGTYAMSIQYQVGSGGWCGVQQVFPTSQDWSNYQMLEFRFYGTNTGNQIRLELADNAVPGSVDDTAERFEYKFIDNFTGWRAYSLPWGSFTRRQDWQPSGAPNDGLTLTQVQAFSFAPVSGSGNFRLDQVQLAGGGIELLPSPWNLIGNNGAAEKYQSIPATSLNGKVSLTITYDLHGLCALDGDASAIIFDQDGWRYISLSRYGQNCLNGPQTVTIPLSDFPGLNTSANVGTFHTRFWYSGPFTVDILSAKLNGPSN